MNGSGFGSAAILNAIWGEKRRRKVVSGLWVNRTPTARDLGKVVWEVQAPRSITWKLQKQCFAHSVFRCGDISNRILNN